jgi:hypothetical protein
MTTAQSKFPRLESAGVQGARVVGREQLTKIGATYKGLSWVNKGEPGERNKGKSTQEAPIRKK